MLGLSQISNTDACMNGITAHGVQSGLGGDGVTPGMANFQTVPKSWSLQQPQTCIISATGEIMYCVMRSGWTSVWMLQTTYEQTQRGRRTPCTRSCGVHVATRDGNSSSSGQVLIVSDTPGPGACLEVEQAS